MDTPFLHIVLLGGGFLSGSILFSLVLIPILYGLPHLLSWTTRRFLEWRALLLYVLPPLLWGCASYALVDYLGVLFGLEIVTSAAFIAGLWLASLAKGGKLALSAPARQQIRTRLLDFATPYLTAKGAASLRGLWTSMPQIQDIALRPVANRRARSDETEESDVSEKEPMLPACKSLAITPSRDREVAARRFPN